MKKFTEVNRLIINKQYTKATSILTKLISENPEFYGYYEKYISVNGKLSEYTYKLAKDNLDKVTLNRIKEKQQVNIIKNRSEEQFFNKENEIKISFCISVKNRSKLSIVWNGITRNKVFVSSYKDKPISLDLELLKNCIKSIVFSQIDKVKFEIIIVDFNSTDDPPKEWILSIIPKNIDSKIINKNGNFSRGLGLNIAANTATGNILFFTDADMLFSKELISQVIFIVMKKNKAFFPICYSYLTPFHQEGWVRSEGWGNLAILTTNFNGLSWWEKNSWGSEDDHMKDQLKKNYHRCEGIKFYHQWHPEGEFKTKFYQKEHNKFSIVIAVTTYNRIEYLKEFISSWNKTKNKYYNWTLIISDDGSTDGTINYIDSLTIESVKVIIIKHQRTGVHESTNSIIDRCNNLIFDYGFKCDDDIKFIKSGWDDLYIKGMSTFEYLCNYNVRWRDAKPIAKEKGFIAYSSAYYSQGAFWTFTKNVLNTLGWFDTLTFGYKGYGHIDFSVRACRAGFNKGKMLFDIEDSASYISLQLDDYIPAMSLKEVKNEFGLTVSEEKKEQMRKKILDERSNTIYVNRSSIYEFYNTKHKPKIHIIIHNNHIGGAEYVHYCHAKALIDVGCDLKIWSIGDGYFYNKFKSDGFDIEFIPKLLDNESKDLSNLSSSINSGDYIYNCNAYNDDLFKKIASNKYIYYLSILHSDMNWIIDHQVKNKYFVYKFISIHNNITKNLLESGVNNNKIFTINNSLMKNFEFIHNDQLNLKLRKELNIPFNATVFGFVGRIAKDKNIFDLLEIFDDLLKNRDDAYCLIIGGSSKRVEDKGYINEFNKKINSISNNKRLIFLGEKVGNEVDKLLNVFDVAVNVSPSEGVPISMLEQLAKGCYCVYPNFPGIASVLSLCSSSMINIIQRKNGQNLNYSKEEKNKYINELVKLNRIGLLKKRNSIISMVKEHYSHNKLKKNIGKVFYKN